MAEETPDEKPKDVYWMGSSREDLRAFPLRVKKETGSALTAVQYGKDHPALKMLSGFGGGKVWEVRTDDPSGTYRVVYTVEFADAVYVLHSFQKKSKKGSKTPKEEMDRVHRRLEAARADYEARRRPLG